MEPSFEITIHIVHETEHDKWQWSMKFGPSEWPIASVTGEEESLTKTMEQILRIIRWGKTQEKTEESEPDPDEK